MALPERPEPMNAITNHSKVKVSITVSDPTFVAGKYVSGKMEMECRADKGLGIGVIMVELSGMQELSSRDHSATSTFFHAKRLFQGPGLPPSNAVQVHSEPGDPPLPSHHYHARRGISTFLFRIPLPITSPSSVNFGGGLATVKYELRASASVSWRGEKRLVTERKAVDVIEGLDDVALAEYVRAVGVPSITVGENGKLWMQGIVVGGGIITAGESACVELQVKNHSTKKNTGLTLSLTRRLALPNIPSDKQPLQITDILSNVAFRGQEYIIQPGVEGVANLVFDIPKTARGVKGGSYEDEAELRPRITPSIFEVQCIVSVKMGMGIGNKDLVLDIPVTIVSPLAIPHDVVQQVLQTNMGESVPYPGPQACTPYRPPISSPPPPAFLPPMFTPYTDYNHVWFPPPQSPSPFQYITQFNPLYYPVTPPPPQVLQNFPPPRPASALAGSYSQPTISGLPATAEHHPLLPLNLSTHYESTLPEQCNVEFLEPEEGKGERASRVTHRLRMSSRHRSASPQSHRFPLPPLGRPVATTDAPVHARTLPSVPFMSSSPHHEAAPQPLVFTASSHLYSPRPVLSPRVSHTSLRSERVEELERLVAEVDVVAKRPSTSRKRKKGSRKGKEKEVLDPTDINKTLPPPPVPTRKGFLAPPQDTSSSYPVVTVAQDAATKTPTLPNPALAEKAPPTPTLTAMTPVRHSRSNLTERLAAERLESGLDALEKRLLAEVGTKKVERIFSTPRVQRIFDDPSVPNVSPVQDSPTRGRLSPIKIPPPRTRNIADDDELRIDSAISSLTLADGGLALGAGRRESDGAERDTELRLPRSVFEEVHHDHELDGDSDERTHRAGTVGGKSKSKSSLSGDDGQEEQRQKKQHRRQAADGPLPGSELDTNDRADSRGRSREGSWKERKRGKKREGHKRRKSVQGRVAAWLGAIDTGALPPEEDVLESSFPMREVVHQDSASPDKIQDVKSEGGPAADVPTTAPNPRSSGFMPIGTQKHNKKPMNPNPFIAENTDRHLSRATSAAGIPGKPASQWSGIKSPVIAKQMPTSAAQGQKTSASGDRGDKLQRKPKGHAIKAAVDEFSKVPIPMPSQLSKKTDTRHDGLRFPIPPLARARSQDPAVKYDMKSARGGRGGQVTAIATFWASAAANEAPKRGVSSLTKATSIDNSCEQAITRANAKPDATPRTSKPATPSAQPPPVPRVKRPQLREVNKAQPSLAVIEPSPKLLGIPGKSGAMSKSPVPAVVSSSLATPMLSTTASLVRPPVQQLKRPVMTAINSTVAETPRSPGPVKAKSTPDLAFGKARLRDLIKKYQEQGS